MVDYHIHLKKGVNDYAIMKLYIEKCISLGLKEVVFLDHGNRVSTYHTPVLNNQDVIDTFLKLIARAKKEYNGIKIYSGIEVDYFPDKNRREKELKIMNNNFDFILGSVHGVKDLNLSRKDYYRCMLELTKKYPIKILAHLKIYDDYLEYQEDIDKILASCKKRNIMLEINTSDRSIWSIQVFDYMMDKIKEYNLEYTIGSDAHSIDELLVNYDLVYDYLNHFIGKDNEIEYNIISRGTEKAGSSGYMAITKEINNSRFLIVQPHLIRNITSFKDSLKCYNYGIKNIAFSRFELISSLVFERNEISDNILLCGLGNIGITALINLLDNGYKNISIYLRKTKPYIRRVLDSIKIKYKVDVKIVKEIDEYNTYIDTTGSSEVIELIFKNIKYNKKVIFLGTPREGTFLIDPLIIHRNNLMLIGAHELKGIKRGKRIELFEKLLLKNKDNELIDEIVNINNYKKGIIEKILDNKSHFIEVIKYDNKD